MNAEMQRTWELLRDLLPARVLAILGGALILCAFWAWPMPGLLHGVHVRLLEFVPTVLLGGLGIVALFIGGVRMIREKPAAKSEAPTASSNKERS